MNRAITPILSLSVASLLASCSTSQARDEGDTMKQYEELGTVLWHRDHDEALELATKEAKPVLILFQEVPGCATCRNYGHNVLSHPLLVEAIENEFIPLAIFNNKGGNDKAVLDKYNEPSWNNPVVRIVNATGKDLVPRVASDYSQAGLYTAMVKALNAEQKTVPAYMKLLGDEILPHHQGQVKEAYYKMYCFWSGEQHLGSEQGVLSTEAGFANGHEVVKVSYDPHTITTEQLNAYARSGRCEPLKDQSGFRISSKDLDYQLRHTPYKYLPLSEIQRTRINSALGTGKPAEVFLSPQQLEWLHQVKTDPADRPMLFNHDLTIAWMVMEKE